MYSRFVGVFLYILDISGKYFLSDYCILILFMVPLSMYNISIFM